MKKLGPEILKILAKKHEPDTLVYTKFGRYDLAIKTDKEGDAVLLFMGEMNEKGQIAGWRYARTFKKDQHGQVIKDHWELKGKAS
jgi:hypothetical protein